MSALDVLEARRRVIEQDLTLRKIRLAGDQEDLEKSRKALASIIEAQAILEDAGFTREWPDQELGRMRFTEKLPLDE